ncbi:hypothetical protein HPB50_005830 [Hyalomma asiaticum]|uniref:Uncharacterized protein n=1 Tax=Hyalomma asiaticum TaxID=266040 RepID=A0ACB7T687_HYAAI|nr:hypothetical protein HPB50_005830 [Hyalomma asiaticum]
MAEPTKLWSTDVGLPADCVEFCPVKPHLFVVGMYKLDEEAGKRQGALTTFQWHGGADVRQLCHSGSLPGVLDVKWKDDILAGAFSDGTVQLYRQQEQQLEPEASCQAANCLALAVAWAPGHTMGVTAIAPHPCEDHMLASGR